MTAKTPSSATSRKRLSVRPSMAQRADRRNPGCELVEPETLGMIEHRRLGAPRQHAGLDRLYLPIEIVALSGELIDLVVGGGQLDRLGEIDQSDQEARSRRHRSAPSPGATGRPGARCARVGVAESRRWTGHQRVELPPCAATPSLVAALPHGAAPRSSRQMPGASEVARQ